VNLQARVATVICGVVLAVFPQAASAADPSPVPSAAPAPSTAAAAAAPGAPAARPTAEAAYETFIKDAEKQAGLFTVWRKEGKVYLELSAEQFDKEYLMHATTANGLGGYGVLSGDDFLQEARSSSSAATRGGSR